jgi:hypothetical protein
MVRSILVMAAAIVLAIIALRLIFGIVGVLLQLFFLIAVVLAIVGLFNWARQRMRQGSTD